MTIKPIRTKEDHERALERIQELWAAEPGTQEGDELEILAALVHDWEHFNIPLTESYNLDNSNDDGIVVDDPQNLTINPQKIRLNKLLEIAETQTAGFVSLMGDTPEGITQWGAIVICGNRSRELMNALQATLYHLTDNEAKSVN